MVNLYANLIMRSTYGTVNIGPTCRSKKRWRFHLYFSFCLAFKSRSTMQSTRLVWRPRFFCRFRIFVLPLPLSAALIGCNVGTNEVYLSWICSVLVNLSTLHKMVKCNTWSMKFRENGFWTENWISRNGIQCFSSVSFGGALDAVFDVLLQGPKGIALEGLERCWKIGNESVLQEAFKHIAMFPNMLLSYYKCKTQSVAKHWLLNSCFA